MPTFRIPGLSYAKSQVVGHVATVFLVAFATQVSFGLTGDWSIPTLRALLFSALASGATATIHYLTGLSPTPVTIVGPRGATELLTAPKLRSTLYTNGLSGLSIFVSILLAALATGAVHWTSLPSVADVGIAGTTAIVSTVVQYTLGLFPVAKSR